MFNKKKEFRDIDLDFRPHPVSGDIVTLKDVDAIKRSVRNLILHNIHERPFKPDVGSDVKASLFENMGHVEIYQLRQNISTAINRYEKRVKLTDINIKNNSDKNQLDVTITFLIENSEEPYSITVYLKRVR